MISFSRISELLYPRHRPVCDRLLAGDEPYICRKGAGKVKWIRGPVCMKCGRPLDAENKEYCDNCRRRSHLYERNLAPFVYGNEIQTSNHMVQVRRQGSGVCSFLCEGDYSLRQQRQLEMWKPQMIIPFRFTEALHPQGVQLAGALAEQLSKLLDVPVGEGLGLPLWLGQNTRLAKGTDTIRETLESSGEFFAWAEGTRLPERLLIVDDIYTTGTTVDTLAGVLLAGGARKVWSASVSIAPGRS